MECAVPGWPLRRVRKPALLPLSLKSATILGRGRVRGHEYAIQRDTCRQAQVFVLTCQRSGRSAARTVRSKATTPYHCAEAQESNCGLRYGGLTAVATFPLPKIGNDFGQGEGSENAIWADAFAGKYRHSSSPASKLADLRKRRCSPKRTSTLQLRRGEGIKLWLTLCRTGCCGYFPSP